MYGYIHRAARHLSAAMFLWLPIAGCLYAFEALGLGDWTLDTMLGAFAILTTRALWRALGPAVQLSASGDLAIRNPWRTHRVKVDAVRGYTWTSPAWTGRDSAPVLGLVLTPRESKRRMIRMAALSGEDALKVMAALHIPEAREGDM